MEETPRYVFSRPQNQKQPTRFLFVGLDSADRPIEPFFSDNDIECIVKAPSPFVYFVVFRSEASAVAAKLALSGGIKAIKFAEGKLTTEVQH